MVVGDDNLPTTAALTGTPTDWPIKESYSVADIFQFLNTCLLLCIMMMLFSMLRRKAKKRLVSLSTETIPSAPAIHEMGALTAKY